MGSENITVLVIEPEKRPYVKTISSGLASLQKEVDGYIQAIYPWEDTPCCIVCDEEGKLKNKQYNRVLRDEDGYIYDAVAGTFLIVGLGEDNFVSLESKYIKQYTELFSVPELFFRIDDKLVVIPMQDGNEC